MNNNEIKSLTKDYIKESCRLCGSNENTLLFYAPVLPYHNGIFAFDKWPISKCKNCGLVFQSVRPDDNALDEYYKFDNEGDREYIRKWFIENSTSRVSDWKRYLKIISHYKKSGLLLDVGCGAGDFIVEAEKLGYSTIGQEVSNFFIEFCKSHHYDVLEGDLLSQNLHASTFDIVSIVDVIEHVTNPKETLDYINYLLKPDGVLFIVTHDIGNIFSKLYGVKWRHMIPIGHLTFFTKRTLGKMLNISGFKIATSGGGHTIDQSFIKRSINWIKGILKYIILRSCIIYIYKPITDVFPFLKKWKFQLKNKTYTHDRVMIRVGNQIIINDDLVIVAKKETNSH